MTAVYELTSAEMQRVDFAVMSALYDAVEEPHPNPERVRRRLEAARIVQSKHALTPEPLVFALADAIVDLSPSVTAEAAEG